MTTKGKEEEEDEAGHSEAGPSWEQEEEAELMNEAVPARIPVPGSPTRYAERLQSSSRGAHCHLAAPALGSGAQAWN